MKRLSIPPYGIAGRGLAARHMARYLRLSRIPFTQWSRADGAAPEATFKNCRTILLLISDNAIEDFISAHPGLHGKTLVHFSGSHVSGRAAGLHPLCSLGRKPLSLAQCREIAFVSEKGRPAFRDIFPMLKNPSYAIDPALKPYYHALCVMAGNFSTALWQKLFSGLENELGLPAKAAKPYLRAVLGNIESNHTTALTGPFARGDYGTIARNLRALDGDAFLPVYKAFRRVLCK
ncbi:MAG: DUF2520 domain-containing protein [Elusimicrobiales bacterium]